MAIYHLIQLGPGVLREKIKHAEGNERRRYQFALVLRDILLLAFAVVYIASFTHFFGTDNSSVAVSSFCMLLALRFVGYGYHVTDSVLALGIVLIVMFVNGLLWTLLPPVLGFFATFSGLLLILLLTTSDPRLGNGGLYTFAYIFIVTSPVAPTRIASRALALGAVFILLAIVMFRHHRYRALAQRAVAVVRRFSWQSVVGIWQIRLASGVSLALLIAQSLGVERPMWMGYAAMSVLLPQSHLVLARASQRVGGVIVGTLLFSTLIWLLPPSWQGFIGPLGGFGLGLTANYFGHSVLNCFGALSLAYALFGLVPAASWRIGLNLLGAVVALGLAVLFRRLQLSFGEDVTESAE